MISSSWSPLFTRRPKPAVIIDPGGMALTHASSKESGSSGAVPEQAARNRQAEIQIADFMIFECQAEISPTSGPVEKVASGRGHAGCFARNSAGIEIL